MIFIFENIKSNLSSCVLIGDKGYLSDDYQLELFTSNQIKLEVPMILNQHDYEAVLTFYFRLYFYGIFYL